MLPQRYEEFVSWRVGVFESLCTVDSQLKIKSSPQPSTYYLLPIPIFHFQLKWLLL